MDRVLDGEAVTEKELDDNDNRQASVALAQLAAFIAAAFFLHPLVPRGLLEPP